MVVARPSPRTETRFESEAAQIIRARAIYKTYDAGEVAVQALRGTHRIYPVRF
jgi:hypothetical protein